MALNLLKLLIFSTSFDLLRLYDRVYLQLETLTDVVDHQFFFQWPQVISVSTEYRTDIWKELRM